MPQVPAPGAGAGADRPGRRKDRRAGRPSRHARARSYGQAAELGAPVKGEVHAASRPIAPANDEHDTLEDLADEPTLDEPVASDEQPVPESPTPPASDERPDSDA